MEGQAKQKRISKKQLEQVGISKEEYNEMKKQINKGLKEQVKEQGRALLLRELQRRGMQ